MVISLLSLPFGKETKRYDRVFIIVKGEAQPGKAEKSEKFVFLEMSGNLLIGQEIFKSEQKKITHSENRDLDKDENFRHFLIFILFLITSSKLLPHPL